MHPDSEFDEKYKEEDRVAVRIWVCDSGARVWGRRIFIAGTELLGMVTNCAREMSFVFPLDVILFRKVDNHYIYPGELYVDEYIHGKAFDGLDRGERQLVATLRDFLERELKNLFALRSL
jgi:hypothetical protein